MAKQTKLFIRSKTERRRRAGIAFTRQGAEFNPGKISKAKMDAILADPLLIVTSVEEADDTGAHNDAEQRKKLLETAKTLDIKVDKKAKLEVLIATIQPVHEALIQQAETLGIENIAELPLPELRAAVDAAIKAQEQEAAK